jgi:hypothetical protein
METRTTALAWLRFDSEREQELAKKWLEKNAEARKVRLGRWQQLLRIAHSASGYGEMRSALEAYLENAPARHGEARKNRWSREQLTASLLRAIQDAATIDEEEVPTAHLGILKELEGSREAAVVWDIWRLERAQTFLTAMVEWLKAEGESNVDV